jgi:ADP-L-glycero-D-manno-heptose 6-epimerase
MTPGWNDGRVLVTGGAGFIGSALVWALNQRGYRRILIADRLDATDKWRNLAPLAFEDYLDADAVLAAIARGALDDVGLVLHMGACSSTTETNSDYLMQNNVEYTKALADWCVGQGIRFVYASSAATYGGREGLLSETTTELSALRPLNMYGYSKHLFDLYATQKGYLDRIVGLKYFNVFGPNEQHKGDMRSMVDKAFGQITSAGRIRLFKSYRKEYADGEQVRDFLYVKDAVEMTLHLAERATAGLFNIGSGESHTWLELTGAVFDAMGKPRQVDFIEMPEAIRPKYQYNTRADISRLRAAGYDRPITPLAEAVKDYVQNYLMRDHRLGDES